MSEAAFLSVLNPVTRAYLTGDLELLRAHVALPLRMDTRSGAYVIADNTELEADFALYQDSIKTHGITDIIRQLHHIQRWDETTLKGTYTTHIMNRAQRIVDPFEATMTLREVNGTWLWTRLENGLGHTKWFCDVPHTQMKMED